MKMQALLSAFLGIGLLLALNSMCVVSGQTMFVFGDSFVDNGNIPKPRQDMSFENSRQWFYPYGISNDEGTPQQEKATGRFSDFMVQSDFIAKMLGLPQSPPTYQSTSATGYCSPAGMNFAFASSGVFQVSFWVNLREQVDYFEDMIKNGNISKNHVTHSVALIATSVNDYKKFGQRNAHDNSDFIAAVTTEIAANVERLQNLGVKRILVNNLHPFGCNPALSRAYGYKVCHDFSNLDAAGHNSKLEEKLATKKRVFIVDLHAAFASILGLHGEDSDSSYKQFKQKRKPCCEAIDPKGFCAQMGDNSKPLYTLCADPSEYFFWDDAHPTHAAWQAVMMQLQDPIKKFLGIV